MPEFLCVVIIRTPRRSTIALGIVEVPISVQLEVPVGCGQVMARRHLKHSVKESAYLMSAAYRVIEGLGVPFGWNAGGKQGLHFRRQVKRLFVNCIKQGLDAEPITGRENGAVCLIPNYQGKFTTEPMDAFW